MRFKTTLILFSVSLSLLLAVWAVRQREIVQLTSRTSKVLSVSSDEIVRFTVERGDLSLECVKSHGRWLMTHPVSTRARNAEVNRLLTVLEDLDRLDEITVEQMDKRGLTPADYGISDKPRARIVLSSARRTLELVVGNDTPFDDHVYAQLGSESVVLVTSIDLVGVLPSDLDILRERRIFDGALADITRLEIQRSGGGFIDAVRQGGKWVMRQPVKGARLRDASMLRLLRGLQVEATRFVDVADPEVTGLSEGPFALEIGIWSGDEQTAQRVLIGKISENGSGEVYAKRSDGDLIYAVPSSIVDNFTVKANDLRDPTVFPIAKSDVRYIELADAGHRLEISRVSETASRYRAGRDAGETWRVVAPRDWRADKRVVEELLTDLTTISLDGFIEGAETNLVAYGLSEPERTIRISTHDPSAGEGTSSGDVGDGSSASAVDAAPASVATRTTATGDFSLLLGREIVDGQGIYARLGDDLSVFKLSGDAISNILSGRYESAGVTADLIAGAKASGKPWISPLVFCDRTVMRIEPMRVESVSLVRKGTDTVTVQRRDNHSWSTVVPFDAEADEKVIRGLLSSVVELEAIRIVHSGEDGFDSYGLKAPEIKLTFGFSGEESISTTLMIGFKAKTDGVYAMIQGRDVVFVLPKHTVSRLIRSLVVLPEADEDTSLNQRSRPRETYTSAAGRPPYGV